MSKRQYRLVLLDERGEVISGAQYMHVSERTPLPGDRMELPGGVWIVEEVAATFSGDDRSRLVHADDYGGTLICKPEANQGQPQVSG
jgi:hypothetical protein